MPRISSAATRAWPALLSRLGRDDLLVVTADHGNDPTTPSTDHSREYVPIMSPVPAVRPDVDLGTRSTFADLGQTLAELFKVAAAGTRNEFSERMVTACRPSVNNSRPARATTWRRRPPTAPRAAAGCATSRPIRSARCFSAIAIAIIHSKAFRRLKHKTQVFFAPTGDHYRTRLTHTLEVSQIARSIAKVLRLHEELTEAIALGHDLGHPPFGHAGRAGHRPARARRVQPLRAEPAHRRRARERPAGPEPHLGSARRDRAPLQGQARAAGRRAARAPRQHR